MAFICIDTFSFLSMPDDREEQHSEDFLVWVGTYLSAHPKQPYQYDAIEVYAARCALLHTYGSEAAIHRKNPSIKMFAYQNGGKHMYQPDVAPNLVLIGTASFFNDIVAGVCRFMEACANDPKLKATAERRLSGILQHSPINRQ